MRCGYHRLRYGGAGEMSVRIINADVMDGLAQLADESVHCVMTSPPYWGLRDYGVPGQLGLETTLGEHLDKMVAVFREVRRVLRKDGTLWLNYGDCYAASPNGRSAAATKAIGKDDRTFRDKPFSTIGPIARLAKWSRESERGGHNLNADDATVSDYRPMWLRGGLKPKDLCGVPWRLALALQADGWWLRQDIIWSKPNPMPESIKDRCTKAHEYLFLLAKSERYYFDGDAIAEPLERPEESERKTPAKFGGALKHVEAQKQSRLHSGNEYRGTETGTRNKRSVWEVATQPFPEAHFATFPPALIEPCIKAGCPEGGTVLDPFGGSGTTGLVADRLKRNAVLIEINSEYAAMAERRIAGDCPMFAEVSAV